MDHNTKKKWVWIWIAVTAILIVFYFIFHRTMPHTGPYALYTMLISACCVLVIGAALTLGGILLIIQEKSILHYLFSLLTMICGVLLCIYAAKQLPPICGDLKSDTKETVFLEDCLCKTTISHTYTQITTLYGYHEREFVQYDVTGVDRRDLDKICEEGYPVRLRVYPNTGCIVSYEICNSLQMYATAVPDSLLRQTQPPKDRDSYDYDRRLLLAEDKKHDIRLYGLHLGKETLTLLTVGEERLILEQSWHNGDMELPVIDYKDIDRDGSEEVLLLQHFHYTADTKYDELSVIHRTKNGDWTTATLTEKDVYQSMSPRFEILYHPADYSVDLLLYGKPVQKYTTAMKRDPKKMILYPVYEYTISAGYMKLTATPAICDPDGNVLHRYTPVTFPLSYEKNQIIIRGKS